MSLSKKHYAPAWVEIDLKALKYNFSVLQTLARKNFVQRGNIQQRGSRSVTPGILCVVKAGGYGHGMVEVAAVLQKAGVAALGVSDLSEGTALRKNGITCPIILFESAHPKEARAILENQLTPTVCSHQMAAALNVQAGKFHKKIALQVSVDTGMSRLGVSYQAAAEFILGLEKFQNITLQGIYTHFPVADTDKAYTRQQIRRLDHLVEKLKASGVNIPQIHAANSMGLAGYKTNFLNMFRPGLMLYGLHPKKSMKKAVSLKPVMSVKSRVLFVRRIKKGSGVSYGHTFIAKKDLTVATISIGYNDGYLRALSNKAQVLVGGKLCPQVGRVTMDQIVVDVSSVRNLATGDEVVVLGHQGRAEISADALAAAAGTINYEIVCCFGNRLPHFYKKQLSRRVKT